MAYIAVRWTHFPHQTGAEEARERGHGPDIQLVANIVADFNYLWASLESSASDYGVEDLLRDLGLAEEELEDLVQMCEGDYYCLLDEAVRLTKQAIAEKAEKHGYRVIWFNGAPFIVVGNGILLGVDVSPHDDDITQFHFIFVASDLPLPILRCYLPKVLNMMKQYADSDFENGWAEIIYDIINDRIIMNKVYPDEDEEEAE